VRKAIYGADAALFGPRREGLVGHPQGKSLVRCGIDGLTLRQHWPRRYQGQAAAEMLLDHGDGAYLLHMIGADYDIWRSKLLWRSGSRGFTDGLSDRVAAALGAAAPEAALRDLYRRLHCATPEQLDRFRDHGVLLTLRMDVASLVQEYFWVAPGDLTATGGTVAADGSGAEG